jgi:hypothetical protein
MCELNVRNSRLLLFTSNSAIHIDLFIHHNELTDLPSIAQQHDCSRASTPAFANIWALRFFTDRVQVELCQRFLDLGVARISSCKCTVLNIIETHSGKIV